MDSCHINNLNKYFLIINNYKIQLQFLINNFLIQSKNYLQNY